MASASSLEFSSKRMRRGSAAVQGADFLSGIAFIVPSLGPGRRERFRYFGQGCRFSKFMSACQHTAGVRLAVYTENQRRAQSTGLLKGKQPRGNSPPDNAKQSCYGILQGDDKLTRDIQRDPIRGSYAFPQRLCNPLQ